MTNATVEHLNFKEVPKTTTGPQPFKDVTAENYHRRAREFMGMRKPFLAAREKVYYKTDSFPATPKEWAAWLAYWHRLGVRTKFSERLGYSIVPTQWPHEFDANALDYSTR
jgi:hypothetical protein